MDALNPILLGFPVYYIVRILLLQQKISHEGPFKSKNKLVLWPSTKDGVEYDHIQHVAAFDWLRRLFLVYKIKGNHWIVKDGWISEVWSCPVCLSFWIAFPFALISAYPFAGTGIETLIHIFIAHLTIASTSSILSSWTKL